jgi:hypothetical protein
MYDYENDNQLDSEKVPGGLLWPLRRLGWALEKYVLWPVSDSFRKFSNAFRYRSPLTYIGATLMVTVTAGAVAAAVYFYNQSEEAGNEPATLADSPITAETVVPPQPTPTPTPTPVEDTTPDSGDADRTLQGVVPDLTAGKKKGGAANQKLPATVVRPAPTPKAPPLRVAHRFATTFVSYEVGKKGAADRFADTATPKLARELKKNPPKLPAGGQIPKATVVNVVRGKKSGDSLAVSVSLMRSGAASELRLILTKQQTGWRVSKVRG